METRPTLTGFVVRAVVLLAAVFGTAVFFAAVVRPHELPPVKVANDMPTPYPAVPVTGGKLGDNAVKAIVLTRFGGGQCSGTLIGPRLKNGKYHILTAYHCDPKGGTVNVRLWDQRVITARSITGNRRADVRWLETTRADLAGLPVATLAKQSPPVGTRIWHRSFGVDRPGNLEMGTVTARPNADGQIEYRISVSPGDSGGGAYGTKDDVVYSPWCCTTRLGGVGRVWGGAPEHSWALRPGFASKETDDALAAIRSDAVKPAALRFVPVLMFADH